MQTKKVDVKIGKKAGKLQGRENKCLKRMWKKIEKELVRFHLPQGVDGKRF